MQDLGDLAAWIRCAYEARVPELTPHEQSPVPGEQDATELHRISRQVRVDRRCVVSGVEAEEAEVVGEPAEVSVEDEGGLERRLWEGIAGPRLYLVPIIDPS